MAAANSAGTAVQSPDKEPEQQTNDRGTPPRLTAVILTLNEEKHIAACIHSLVWADEIIVFDSFSDDATVALAEAAGAAVLQHPFQNYAQQRNAALDAVRSDWVFFVDADERASGELATEIRRVIAGGSETAWYVPRHNIIFGKVTLGAGWYPDYQLRLFRHGLVRFERPVHEIAVVQGEKGYLENSLLHYNYEDKAHFQRTQEAYTTFDAGILHQEGIKAKPHYYLSQPLRHFWWRYVTLKGYAGGLHGLRLSAYMAYYEAVKYRKLAQLWREKSGGQVVK